MKPSHRPTQASSAEHWSDAFDIFKEYAESLAFDLCFQNFDQELSHLSTWYSAPNGALLLLYMDGVCAGCCALRRIDTVDVANAAEMKRLYVKKAYRRFGLGRSLTQGILDIAAQSGYSCVLLDTMSDMEAARALYADLGFYETGPYYHNPIPGAHYLRADL
jgi:putative acetyltransferase